MIKLRCEAGDNSFSIDRPLQFVEDNPRAVSALQDMPDLPEVRRAACSERRSDLASRGLELPHHEQLVIVVVRDSLQFPFALSMD